MYAFILKLFFRNQGKQNLSKLVRDGHLQEVLTIVILLRIFWKSGCLREVVTQGGSTLFDFEPDMVPICMLLY